MLRNNADARRCSYFELGLPLIWQIIKLSQLTNEDQHFKSIFNILFDIIRGGLPTKCFI